MKRLITVTFFICLFTNGKLKAQKSSQQKHTDTSLALNGDTLFTGSDLKVFVGQVLIIGKGSEENGWYKSIGFKSDFSIPVWLNRDLETKNNYDYQTDPQIRINDKVAEYLVSGDSLTITKLKKDGSKRRGYYYTAFLRNKKLHLVNFRSNITDALETEELLLKPETNKAL